MSLPLFYALYCIEAGVFFTIVPCTRLWTLNTLRHRTPWLSVWVDNSFFRGFVSGVGIVHLIVGIHELMRITRARRGRAGS